MTREDLYLTVHGQPAFQPRPSLLGAGGTGFGAPTSNAFAWDMWRRDPSRNPALQQATPDDEALEYGRMAHELSQQLLMKENARKSKEKVALLQRALANPNGANLFSAPQDDFEAQLQRIMQGDIDAGSRGWQYGLKGQERNYREAKEAFARRLQSQNAAVDRAKLYQDALKNERDYQLKKENDNHRRKYQDSLLRQNREDDVARGYDSDAQLALEMVRDFGMDPEEAIRVFGIQGSGQQVLRSIGSMVDTQNDSKTAIQDESLDDYADLFNSIELQARREAAPTPSKSGYGPMGALMRAFGYKGAESIPDPETLGFDQLPAVNNKDVNEARMQALKLGLRYDPARGYFPPERRPNPAVPGAALPSAPALSSPQMQNMGGQQSVANVPVVTSRAEVAALPRGARFVWQGRIHTRQ